MESNLHEDSKSSSEEETDRSEQANDDMGTGRSYECVFCKRGFTTAQALGGHMNIHRKDRAKPRPSSVIPSISSKVDDDYYASLRGYPPIQSYPPHYSTAHHHHHEVLRNYQTFFPAASTWDFRPPHSDDLYVQSPQLLNPFEEDWRRSLSLQIGPSHVDDNKGKTEDGSEADELDLELRLGHDP
ncbi:hypothetical protein P3X46_003954 [Hevea brasiliensis]|uniref:C2H2-type domain-containing protein n=1 Tax=Hevea brasiliensis TaxID=3981 RepID=A0ABQ9NB35_HEVBR|nr:zinc finger protein 10-like [Hevea brasiliensis]XP_057986489.1 zinc finger protein 10-like [Hevea brasiliensis]KAJ9188012.1 hypothetical protein P3X46_003413 [Hevea brasiliensis]KAJ9188618.1 hypothetical protein P3X46_003954 [Hevea brasiliensis]